MRYHYYYFTAFGPLTTVDFRGGARGRRRRRGRAAEQLPAGGEGRRQEAEEVGGEAGQESPARGETGKREALYRPPQERRRSAALTYFRILSAQMEMEEREERKRMQEQREQERRQEDEKERLLEQRQV